MKNHLSSSRSSLSLLSYSIGMHSLGGRESEDTRTFPPINKCTLRHMSHNWHHQKKWCQNNMLFLYVHTYSTFFLSINHIHVLRIQCIRTESNKFGILLRCHTLII